MPRPAAVLTDIEGTTTPVSFVHDVLFPYARARLPAFLAAHAGDDAVREAAAMADGRPVLDALLGWMDADAKVTPLKTLQGMIWHEGYARGDLQGLLYPDVAPALRRWHGQGVTLGVYSSGSVAAQRLLFGHSDEGDLTGLFSGWFDTRVGFKREAASYAAIAGALGLAAEAVLFLSDVEAELDAAVAAGMCCCQLVRAQDGTVGSRRHETARDFGQLESRFGLGEASGPF